MRHLILYIFLVFVLTSCFEEDQMVTPHEAGNLMLGEVELTENYKYQVFYDLGTNSVTNQNLISEWDLGFETSDSGWHVILNTSKMMLAGNTGQTNFESVTSKNGVKLNFDVSSGNPDSLAIGVWYSTLDETPVTDGFVYIVDRGTGEDGKAAGLKKVSFSLPDKSTYEIRFANLDGSDEQTAIIQKDTSLAYVCFSFDNGIVDIQPKKENWDLLFTKYSTMLTTDEGEPYPYLVTGVLLNPYKSSVAIDTVSIFETLSFEIAEEEEYFDRQDIIGYHWKEYDFDNDRYITLTDKIFILKTSVGYYYKIRFIDFYNSTGERGYPTFEFLRL